MTSSTGQAVCAVDKPTEVESVISAVQCGTKCIASECCFAYNFNRLDGNCDKYCQLPINYLPVTGCTGFIDAGFECSFPYTYEGQLFYNCIQNITGLPSDSFGCLAINRTTTSCDSKQAAFMAETTEVSVTVNNEFINPSLSVFGWIIFMLKNGSDVTPDWTQAWADYKNGFGSINGSYWLGLERVHLLTSSAKYRLRVEVLWFLNHTWSSVEYWSFAVGDESTDQYRLTIGGFSGDAVNGLEIYNNKGPQNGMKFTTYDADNDCSIDNCAIKHNGGWWYNDCIGSCLTCVIPCWPVYAYVDTSRMMLKPQ